MCDRVSAIRGGVPRCRSAFDTRNRGNTAVRPRARPFRLPRSAITAGDRRNQAMCPTPGSGAPLKPGEFFLGYTDEDGVIVPLPRPEILSRNGSFLAYRRMEEHVGPFPRVPEAERRHTRRTGTGRGETDGPLAQRRSAGARARRKTTRSSAPIRSGTTTSTTRRWIRTVMRFRWARTCAA